MPDSNADVNDYLVKHGREATAALVARKVREQMAQTMAPWHEPLDVSRLILTEPPERAWLFHERLELGRGALATGIGGSSKTRWLYHLALGAVTGRLPWGWEVCRTGRAVLVLTEDTAADVHATLYHTAKGLGLSPDEANQAASRMTIYALAGVDVRLLDFTEEGLTKSDRFDTLTETVETMGDVVFIGLDPALGLTAGDELDQAHQRALGKMADDLAVRTGAAVMLVTHATKASSTSEELTSHQSRGGGAITDAVRAEYALRTMTQKEARKAGIDDLEERKRHVQLVATKGNHLPPSAFVPVWLRRGRHGVLEPADVEFSSVSSAPSRLHLNIRAVLHDLGKGEDVQLAEWRAACIAQRLIKPGDPETQRKSMNRAVAALVKAGEVEPGDARGLYRPVLVGGEGT